MTVLENIDLTTNIGRLPIQNPVLTASGTFGYGREFEPLVELDRLGAIIVKGISLEASKGNPPPRIVETACGMLNAIGLENVGIEVFEKEKLPFLKSLKIPVLANIYGKTIAEYADLAARLDGINGIAGIEVNISCPNVKAGGIVFGVNPKVAYDVILATRRRTQKPLMVKLSPNVTSITEIAVKVAEAGADSISLINTITGMAVDIDSRRPKLANITGGLSGPAIKPIALRMVWEVAQQVDIPVIGIGGICSAADALEYLIAGASAVQIGTANFINAQASTDVIDGIEAFLRQNRISRLQDLIGTLDTSSRN